MKKTYKISLLFFALLLVCLLSSCKRNIDDYAGKGFNSLVTFDFNGGFMDNGVTNISDHIKYAYKPHSKIVDPTTLPRYSINKEGYNFVGWYIDQDYSAKWNFETDSIGDEAITLYAKWEKTLKYSYMLRRIDENGKIIDLYEYTVDAGSPFNDYLNKAKIADYTVIGFYDEDGKPWDNNFKHPGGNADLCIYVYAHYIEGEYTLVSSYNELVNADGNIYLLNDIDCEGQVLNFGDFENILDGNNYTISNFVVNAPNGLNPQYGIFRKLQDGATINNVNFTNVTINSPSGIKASLKMAPLAGSSEGKVVINNVSVSGKIVIDSELHFNDSEYEIEIKLNQAVFDLSNIDLKVDNFRSDFVLEDSRK